MGRNKFTNQQGRNEIKRDKKNKELGLPDNRTGRLQSVGAYYSTGSASPYTHTVGIASKSRTALDTRPAKSDSSTLHAILFRRGDADRAGDCFEQLVLGRTNPLDGVTIGSVVVVETTVREGG